MTRKISDISVPCSSPIAYLVVVLMLFVQCREAKKLNPFSPTDDAKGRVIARVFDAVLYDSDLALLDMKNKNTQDSTLMARDYVNNWVKQQLLLKKANENLTEEQKDVEHQLQEYKNSLIIYLYEKELVRQKLDTVISEEEMHQYYENNKNNFEQKSNIIQLNYVKYDKKKKDIDRIRTQMQQANSDKNYTFIDYCQKNAANYYFKSNVWLEFNDVLKEIPIKTYDQEQFIQNNKYIEVFDENYVYFVKILNFKIKNSISEYPFVQENIRASILNHRKVKLLEELERNMMNEALNENKISIN